jgi:hypothetical protein
MQGLLLLCDLRNRAYKCCYIAGRVLVLECGVRGVNRGVKLQGDTGSWMLLIGFQVNDIIRS